MNIVNSYNWYIDYYFLITGNIYSELSTIKLASTIAVSMKIENDQWLSFLYENICVHVVQIRLININYEKWINISDQTGRSVEEGGDRPIIANSEIAAVLEFLKGLF